MATYEDRLANLVNNMTETNASSTREKVMLLLQTAGNSDISAQRLWHLRREAEAVLTRALALGAGEEMKQ